MSISISVAKKKPKKTGLLKARCEPELANWYESTALMRQQDVADLLRHALRDFKYRCSTAQMGGPDYTHVPR